MKTGEDKPYTNFTHRVDTSDVGGSLRQTWKTQPQMGRKLSDERGKRGAEQVPDPLHIQCIEACIYMCVSAQL